MKVISFNSNGIRAASRKGFWKWFKYQNADFLCIQETKSQLWQLESDISHFPLDYYYSFFDAKKKGYSGVAIYAKYKPQNIIKGIGIDWIDNEGRYIQFDYEKFSIISLYIPSGSSGIIRQIYKMDFLENYHNILEQQIKQRRDIIICGDFNIVHKEIDIKNWKQNQKNSGVLVEERAWLDDIFKLGWVDGFRQINQKPLQYTWWSNRGKARIKNIGWRIDYQIISSQMKECVIDANIYKENWFSDHAPLILSYDYNINSI